MVVRIGTKRLIHAIGVTNGMDLPQFISSKS